MVALPCVPLFHVQLRDNQALMQVKESDHCGDAPLFLALIQSKTRWVVGLPFSWSMAHILKKSEACSHLTGAGDVAGTAD